MNDSSRPPAERRRSRRVNLTNTRIRCVSGEFDELSSGVNFARRLINVGLGGMCVETTGRLRPDVKLSAEIRFDDFGGALRSQAQLIWADTRMEGALETHLAGFRFIGPELTTSVREFLDGGRASMIVAKRKAEYEVLKQNAEERRAGGPRRRWGRSRTIAVLVLALVVAYVGSFGILVLAGREAAPPPGIHFRYPGAESRDGAVGRALTRLYFPLCWVAREAGFELTPDAR
ncbi:MAG TPA: hypothetical protein VMU54_09300 [Planctomycetota bacterium]|nr:hypothetical protein [Planctomycetota bacterium]